MDTYTVISHHAYRPDGTTTDTCANCGQRFNRVSHWDRDTRTFTCGGTSEPVGERYRRASRAAATSTSNTSVRRCPFHAA